MNVPQKISTEKDMCHLLSFLIEHVGWSFHPDRPIDSYYNSDDGSPLFSPEEVKKLESLMNQSFDLCKQNELDIYNKSESLFSETHGDIYHFLHKVCSA